MSAATNGYSLSIKQPHHQRQQQPQPPHPQSPMSLPQQAAAPASIFPGGLIPGLAGYSNPPPGMMSQPPPGPPQHHHLQHHSAASAAGKEWVEHAMPDGRRYYYHLPTGKSVWEKPDDLKTEAEIILSRCLWKEFRTQAGKIYYSHTETRQAVWSKPEELAAAERQAELANQRAAAAASAAAASASMQMHHQPPPAAAAAVAPSASGSSAIEEAMKKTLESFGVAPPQSGGSAPQQPPQQQIRTAGSGGGGKMKKRRNSDNDDDESGSSRDGSDADSDDETNRKKKKQQQPQKQGKDAQQSLEDTFKELLRDRRVPSTATWETAVRMIQEDARYQKVKQLQTRRLVFNNYKTQRQKEEKEEQRLKVKKAREDLEHFLLHTSRIVSTVKYRNAEKMFSELRVWTSVPERDRRDIFEDAIRDIEKREREELRALQRRNIEHFAEILSGIREMSYLTTWTEAQQLLSHSETFRSDPELLEMDKEDALICFQKHITRLEKEEDDKKEAARLRQRRQERKHREAFLTLLRELHTRGRLTANSLWKDCFRDICRDSRFDQMLNQPGSTPLDLFKFFVDDLKKRFPEEKRVVKEIIKERAFSIGADTPLDEFLKLISSDDRGRRLDPGNVERSFQNLRDKALCIEQERKAEERRRLQRHADAFKELMFSADPPVDANTSWDAVTERFGQAECFLAIPLESERLIVFKEFLKSVAEASASGAPLGEAASSAAAKKKKKEKKKKSKSHRDKDKDSGGRADKEKDKDRERERERDRDKDKEKDKDKDKDKDNKDNKDKDREKDKEREKKRKKEKEKERERLTSEGEPDRAGSGDHGGSPAKKKAKKAKKEKRDHKKHKKEKDVGGGKSSASATAVKKRRREDSGESAGGATDDGKRSRRRSSSGEGERHRRRSSGAGGAGNDSMDLSEGELEKERERLIAQLHG